MWGGSRRGCLSVEVHARISLVVAARVAIQATSKDVVVERVLAGIVHGDPHADVHIVSVVWEIIQSSELGCQRLLGGSSHFV